MALQDKCRKCQTILPILNWEERSEVPVTVCEKCGTEHSWELRGQNQMCSDIAIKQTIRGIELIDAEGETIILIDTEQAMRLSHDLLAYIIEQNEV